MRTKKVIMFGTALASFLAVNAFAQFNQPARADKIIGSAITDSQGHKAGSVKDLAIDTENGRVVEVVVAWNEGFFGFGQKLAAALPENFTINPQGKGLQFNLDKSMLQAAPPIDLSQWKDAMTQSRVEQVYGYYGATPYFRNGPSYPHPGYTPVQYYLGNVERASQLLGMDVKNHQDQSIGQVKDLMIDLSGGRVVEAIVGSGRFLDMPDELSAMPLQALHFDATQNILIIDTSKEALAAAPHFPGHSWPDFTRQQATDVYQAYHVVPYFLPIGFDSTVQTAPQSNVASPDQAGSQADREITGRIEKEIMNTPKLSDDARKATVTTVNGHVTLRGQVDSTAEKLQLGAIAARFVPAANVDNRLEIKPATLGVVD